MKIFNRFRKKKIKVLPNRTGYLFKKNVLEQRLEAGVYKFWDFKNEINCIELPKTAKSLSIINQEVLTKDNIAFRFSFYLNYKIVDGEKVINHFLSDYNTTSDWDSTQYGTCKADYSSAVQNLDVQVRNLAQIHTKNIIASYQSEELNDKRSELNGLKKEELNKKLSEFGVEVVEMEVNNLTFPRAIQALFSKHLEAKIRAKSDLENARTAVATARTLKNAADLMKDDENIRFFQMIETISKIAETGKHTFMIGDVSQLGKK